MSPARVTLLTDFGTVDGYAAAMAGVIAAAAPSARIDHASHDVPPGDLLTGALTLSRFAFLYPEGTIHLVVVDPGVGTDRRAIAATVCGRFFVGPDNGVLTRVLREDADSAVVTIDPARLGDALAPSATPSATFHGRDVFAPAAALLARGRAMGTLGPAVTDPVLLPIPEPERTVHGISGEVIQVDRYGTLITNIPADWLSATGASAVAVEGRSVGGLRRTYRDVESGELLALTGSLGLIEVSVRDGSAADRLQAERGAAVTIAWPAALPESGF